MEDIFPGTATRLQEWQLQPEVLGVLLVGSKSRGHNDELSDDDLEVLMSEDAYSRLAPRDCLEVKIEGEGPARHLIYDAQLTTLADLRRKRNSPHDLDRWPYEKARILFDRNGDVEEAVRAAALMDPDFRKKRLTHATIDAWISVYRAQKTIKRGSVGAGHMVIARGAKALSRIVFALENRWVPLDHWLEKELLTLRDTAQAGPAISEALAAGDPEPLDAALTRLEPTLEGEGVPGPAGRRDLFLELVHPTRAEERAIHGLY